MSHLQPLASPLHQQQQEAQQQAALVEQEERRQQQQQQTTATAAAAATNHNRYHAEGVPSHFREQVELVEWFINSHGLFQAERAAQAGLHSCAAASGHESSGPHPQPINPSCSLLFPRVAAVLVVALHALFPAAFSNVQRTRVRPNWHQHVAEEDMFNWIPPVFLQFAEEVRHLQEAALARRTLASTAAAEQWGEEGGLGSSSRGISRSNSFSPAAAHGARGLGQRTSSLESSAFTGLPCSLLLAALNQVFEDDQITMGDNRCRKTLCWGRRVKRHGTSTSGASAVPQATDDQAEDADDDYSSEEKSNWADFQILYYYVCKSTTADGGVDAATLMAAPKGGIEELIFAVPRRPMKAFRVICTVWRLRGNEQIKNALDRYKAQKPPPPPPAARPTNPKNIVTPKSTKERSIPGELETTTSTTTKKSGRARKDNARLFSESSTSTTTTTAARAEEEEDETTTTVSPMQSRDARRSSTTTNCAASSTAGTTAMQVDSTAYATFMAENESGTSSTAGQSSSSATCSPAPSTISAVSSNCGCATSSPQRKRPKSDGTLWMPNQQRSVLSTPSPTVTAEPFTPPPLPSSSSSSRSASSAPSSASSLFASSSVTPPPASANFHRSSAATTRSPNSPSALSNALTTPPPPPPPPPRSRINQVIAGLNDCRSNLRKSGPLIPQSPRPSITSNIPLPANYTIRPPTLYIPPPPPPPPVPSAAPAVTGYYVFYATTAAAAHLPAPPPPPPLPFSSATTAMYTVPYDPRYHNGSGYVTSMPYLPSSASGHNTSIGANASHAIAASYHVPTMHQHELPQALPSSYASAAVPPLPEAHSVGDHEHNNNNNNDSNNASAMIATVNMSNGSITSTTVEESTTTTTNEPSTLLLSEGPHGEIFHDPDDYTAVSDFLERSARVGDGGEIISTMSFAFAEDHPDAFAPFGRYDDHGGPWGY